MAKAKRKSKFKGKVTGNAHKQKSQGTQQYGHLLLRKGVHLFKETPGSRVRLDFLPYEVTDPHHPDRDDELEIATPGELWYKRPYKLHRNIGSANIPAVCPTSVGKKCPVCEYRAKLLQEGADWQDDSIRALKASNRNLYVVVPKDCKEHGEKPHVWDISQFLFQDKLNDELEEDEEHGVFPDLEEGLTIRIRFSEEQVGKNKFADTSRIDFEQRDEPYDESILKKVPNLDELLEIFTYSKLEKLFFELEDEPAPEQDIDDADEPVKDTGESSRRRKTATKSQPTEAEAEEDDDEKEEEDEDVCIACEGTGENSKGNVCRICKGTGEPPEKKEEPEPEPEPKKKKKKGKNKKSECPYGHEFGTDCEEFDECDECDEFEACLDAKDLMQG